MDNNTPCKNCCFAVYDGITQTGCSKNRLEKYRRVGATIIEAYDEDKEFYVIKDRLCQFYRTHEWLERLSDKTEEERDKILEYEMMSSFHLIILLQDNSIEKLRETIESINFENYPVAQITVVKPRGIQIQPKEIKKLFDNKYVRWRIENLIVNKKDSQIIHSVQKTVKTQYYCVCKAGFKFPDRYFKTIHKSIINNLIQFGMIEIEENQLEGVVIPLHVHEYWYFHGSVEKTIPENIREYQCQNQDQKIIFQFQELRDLSLQSV